MHYLLFALFCLPSYTSYTIPQTSANNGELRIEVGGILESGGSIHIALYKEASFLQEGQGVTGLILASTGKPSAQGSLEGLTYGTYAVAVYQDMNGNNELDKNRLGIPTEPYAFSNNPRVKWTSPTFEEAAIAVNQSSQVITVNLRYWKDY